MAAYAVISRIGRVDPHLTLHDVATDDEPGPPGGLDVDAIEDQPTVESERISEPGSYAERIARLHELWRQTTFYLFDAESWRT